MLNKDFLQKLTILYVEDDPQIREDLSKVLSLLFKKIITVSNGLRA